MNHFYFFLISIFIITNSFASSKNKPKEMRDNMNSPHQSSQNAMTDISALMADLNQNSTEHLANLYLVSQIISKPRYQDLSSSGKLRGIVLFEKNSNVSQAAHFVQDLQKYTNLDQVFVLDQEFAKHPVFSKHKPISQKKFGLIQVYYVKNPPQILADLKGLLQTSAPQPITAPVTVADTRHPSFPENEAELKAIYDRELDRLGQVTIYRTFMDPQIKPYQIDILDALSTYLSPEKPTADNLTYEKATLEDAKMCEQLFYQEMFQSLQKAMIENKKNPHPKNMPFDASQIVHWSQIHSWQDITPKISNYFRQVIRYQYKNTPYLYMKFRADVYSRTTPPLIQGGPNTTSQSQPIPDNSKEYHVMDGGSNYFEFHCDVKNKKIFRAYVHGEA